MKINCFNSPDKSFHGLKYKGCMPQNRGLFRDLTFGIESKYSSSNPLSDQTNIKHQDFELNDKGVLVENGVTYNIYKNNFNLFVPGYNIILNIDNNYNRFKSSSDQELVGTTRIAGIYTNLTNDAVNHKIATKTYVVKPGEIDRPNQSMCLNVTLNDCINEGLVQPKDLCIVTSAIQENCTGTIENPNPNIGNYFSLKTLKLYWQNEVENAGLSGESLDQAKRSLRFYKIESTQARNHVIWAYNVLATLDSNINYTDSIIVFLDNETDVASRKQLIAAYYAKGDYSNASQYLINLPEGTTEIEQFKNYYNLLIAISGVGRNIYQLTSEEISTLQSIAATQTSAALAAQGILTLVNGDVFNSVIERVESEQLLTSIHSNQNMNDKLFEKYMQIYPNPANLNLIVSYDITLQKFNEDASVQIIDLTGKQLLYKKLSSPNGVVELSTSLYSNGIYFIQLYSGSLLIDTKKVIIQH
ncbi:MAG: T9SS type A sorting domain-containing protein [Bacteroidia bacterium]|nr:T9SS type A sorting domain-containing protein [Bacteroidia bacterium]